MEQPTLFLDLNPIENLWKGCNFTLPLLKSWLEGRSVLMILSADLIDRLSTRSLHWLSSFTESDQSYRSSSSIVVVFVSLQITLLFQGCLTIDYGAYIEMVLNCNEK
ncbi:hypothetical protein GOODEAATRI_020457 [Goodea atripinnis]|uniref:Uncharacterized protein n=1 Tax=Goodea atripinnis TaxID=208336 RepID=A0ABV0NC81_9TELE